MTFSPIIRITFGLVLLTTSILLAGNLLGLMPDTTRASLQARQQFCESLAIQLTLAVKDNNVLLAKSTLEAVTHRDPEILSAALRQEDGSLLVTTAEHRRYWRTPPDELSTPTHVQIPVYQSNDRWGTVEISFRPLQTEGLPGLFAQPFVRLLLFVAALGFVVYYLLIKKALKHLDPSSVIPGRVKAALDVLAEGVVLMDDKGRLVLTNSAFCKKTGIPEKSLLGTRLTAIEWLNTSNGKPLQTYPWQDTLQNGGSKTGAPIGLNANGSEVRTLMVNCAPIFDGKDKVRGALVTFDDITQLEKKNVQLKEMLQMLENSQVKVNKQNEELQRLASRDSLTDCLNRRALFSKIDAELENSRLSGTPMCCIMCDIDHFKNINDQHGHISGDRVIRGVAQAIKDMSRDTDTVGRYGGEEFCILLPDIDLGKAVEIAERYRARIAALDIDGIHVTTSFGITSTEFYASDPTELLQQADAMLYRAKEGGRNCVVAWHEEQAAQSGTT